MEFIIVTGLSGAGKSRAVNVLEDIGFYCVDNMPPKLLPKFAELCLQSQDKLSRVALVIDVRGGQQFEGLLDSLDELKRQGGEYKILFLECSDQVLARRYLVGLFLGSEKSGMQVQCMSFGFKYGYPAEADLVLDVRCLPNPFYVDELKHKTGLDQEVREYVLDKDVTKGFQTRLYSLIDYLLPLYSEEGKSQLVVAIGCTGGKHRSVALAEELAKHVADQGIKVAVNHRDIEKL